MKRLTAVTAAVLAALTVTACGSAVSPVAGAQAASDARPPVARLYWSALAAIYPVIQDSRNAPATGFFGSCATGSGQGDQQVSYEISLDVLSGDHKLSTDAFIARLEQRLRARGWGAFTSSPVNIANPGTTWRSVRDGYDLYVTQQSDMNVADFVLLAVAGPCVTVGTSVANELSDWHDDSYPVTSPAPRTVPTEPVPTPSS
jgi:hypothetical protein